MFTRRLAWVAEGTINFKSGLILLNTLRREKWRGELSRHPAGFFCNWFSGFCITHCAGFHFARRQFENGILLNIKMEKVWERIRWIVKMLKRWNVSVVPHFHSFHSHPFHFSGGKGTDRTNGTEGSENPFIFDVLAGCFRRDLSPHQSGIFLAASQPRVRVTHCAHGFYDFKKLSLAFCLETVRKGHVTIHNGYRCMVIGFDRIYRIDIIL
jgi:hypothetical protein